MRLVGTIWLANTDATARRCSVSENVKSNGDDVKSWQ